MDVSDLTDRLLLAIPKKGRLNEHCLTLLKGADIQFHRRNRLDIALSTNLPLAIVFLPAADIATYVGRGNVDLGITGEDVIAEAVAEDVEAGASKDEAKVTVLTKLGFGKCKLCVQVPVASGFKTAKDLVGKRIVTSFGNVSRSFFDALEAGASEEEAARALIAFFSTTSSSAPGGTATAISTSSTTTIHHASGSVEAACALGLADGIVDLVESGETMREARLHAISTLLTSEAVLIANSAKYRSTNPASAHLALIDTLRRRIEGVVSAQKYLLCNYNIHREKVKEAIKITPGRKAATVSPLEDSEWVAVSAMVLKSEAASVMDRLEAVGASDVLVFQIHNSRVV
ncbi:HisG-domain-containing protein [Fimicolochytrium jonesii]|uniref:HisG-domain-containing protein n=1 Tax=Fimicolochytrium jonesii TaxID=1396493 RepID=UPI0022FF2420|nr:HisG-domain-containing protein [Fimicolochytrium jonesii]KAI8819254.1 HisG-domain-containing protein [Fimicolochytrium jonesii]